MISSEWRKKFPCSWSEAAVVEDGGGVVEVVADDVEVEAAEKMKVVINYCDSALEK